MDARTATVTGSDWSPRWLRWLDASLHREIARLRARYELSLDEFRGLYVSDQMVDRLLAGRVPGPATRAAEPPLLPPPPADTGPLRRLRDEFGLTPVQVGVLVVAAAPELDRRYETLFAYLNDDVTRRHATVDLCLRLTGATAADMDAGSALLDAGLVNVVRAGPSSAWRSSAVLLRAPVRRFLMHVDPVHSLASPTPRSAELVDAAAAIERGHVTSVVLVGPPEETVAAAQCLAAIAGRGLIEPADGADPRDALLSGRLHGAYVYVEASAGSGAAVRAAMDSPAVALIGVGAAAAWRTDVEGREHVVVTLHRPDLPSRQLLWGAALAERNARASAADVRAVAGLFRLHGGQIRRAGAAAARACADGEVDLATLIRCARGASTATMDGLASRVTMAPTWSDLVLPAATHGRLRELAAAIRCRDTVFGDWGFRRDTAGPAPLRALFCGASGTGKTLSAAVVAHELGLELFRIDLSAVVSKYIGETEKNLERVFVAAAGGDAILFFDEADALFGRRSEVKDAHDRYANVEIAYLLQRLDDFDGVLILATNLAKNMDEAFARRIDVEVEFPLPDVGHRERLWRLLMPATAPTGADVDVGFLARQFALTGGDIRTAVLDAAFLAAYEGSDIGMSQLVRAVARQRRKRGKLPSAAEFREYLTLVRAERS